MHTKHTAILSVFIAASVMIPSLLGGAVSANMDVAALFQTGKPFNQDFILTAYYSPEPNQCCYIKGTFADDVALNGNGTNGADGTQVYPGLVAAPPSYPFGTRVSLPGIGTVTVHDRGGAIQVWDNAHRIDVWMGSGEEGLARALAFGVRYVKGVVYPLQSRQPSEQLSLASFSAPLSMIKPYLAAPASLLSFHPQMGDKNIGTWLLQQRLSSAGYFGAKPSGLFGATTQLALASFYRDLGVRTESSDILSASGAALLEAFVERGKASDPIPATVNPASIPRDIAAAKRTLRFLGYYKGRTNGLYDQEFRRAVAAYQTKMGVIPDENAPGAGRIGAKTRSIIVRQWRLQRTQNTAVSLIAMQKVQELVTQRGYDFRMTMGKGQKGGEVKLLQSFLADRGFFPKDQISGLFGATTEKSLTSYQLAAGIIKAPADRGAGTLGPATALSVRRAVTQSLYRLVRAKGWRAL